MRVAVVLLAVVLVAACDDGPAAPGAPAAPDGPFVGTWAGTIVDSAAGTGTARLVLTQSTGISGTFTVTFTNSAFDRAGTVSGTANMATATSAPLFLTPSAPLSCGLGGTIAVTASVSGARLTGNYSALACSGAVTGTLDLSRQ
jgi:hypothetical protein